jgi:lactate dehydrogenase-like 2-hydroxyacid dehydrogenase
MASIADHYGKGWQAGRGAVAAERARLKALVEGLPSKTGCDVADEIQRWVRFDWCDDRLVRLADVLALFPKETP